MRKQQGRPGRLANARPLKDFIQKRNRKHGGSSSSEDDNDKENPLRTPENRGRSRRPVSYQQENGNQKFAFRKEECFERLSYFSLNKKFGNLFKSH